MLELEDASAWALGGEYKVFDSGRREFASEIAQSVAPTTAYLRDYIHVCVRVSVCVCVKERERREIEKE